MTLQRGEVYWVDLNPVQGSQIAKTRPCVVLSRSLLNEHRRTVVVVPLSSSPASAPPLRVPVECGGKRVIAAVDQVRAISKDRLRERMGSLSSREMDGIGEALRVILDLG